MTFRKEQIETADDWTFDTVAMDSGTVASVGTNSDAVVNKDYVDSQIGLNNDLQEVTDNGNTTTNSVTTGGLVLQDNATDTVAGIIGQDLVDKSGIAGGQTIIGGVGAGDDLVLQSNDQVVLGTPGSGVHWDQTTGHLGVGTDAPAENIDASDPTAASFIRLNGLDDGFNASGVDLRSQEGTAEPFIWQINHRTQPSHEHHLHISYNDQSTWTDIMEFDGDNSEASLFTTLASGVGLNVGGSMQLAGDLAMGGNSVTGVNLVDGVDVSAHAADATIHFTVGSIDHGLLSASSLLDDDHTQYALLLGRSGGQVLIGGTGAGDDLELQTTSNGSKGSYILSELTTNGFVKTSGGTGTLSVSTQVDLTSEVTGVLPQANGGSGIDTSGVTNGQLLIGNATGNVFALATLSGTANEIEITNGASSITVGIPNNPTLPGQPTISDFTNATHTHQNAAGGGQLDHGLALTGLTDDDHTQYALLLGRSGGQVLIGGTGAGDDLTLESTSNGTKGDIVARDDILPETHDSQNLGSDTVRWHEVYLGNNSVHIGSSGAEGHLSYEGTPGRLLLTSDQGLELHATDGDLDLTVNDGNDIHVNIGNTIGDRFLMSSAMVEPTGAIIDISFTGSLTTTTDWFQVHAGANLALGVGNINLGPGVNYPTATLGDFASILGFELMAGPNPGAVYTYGAYWGGEFALYGANNHLSGVGSTLNIIDSVTSGTAFYHNTTGNGGSGLLSTSDVHTRWSNGGSEVMRLMPVDGYLGVMETSPTATIHSGGSLAAKVVEKSADYTLDDTETICLVNASATGGVTITLPAAALATDRIYYIKKIDSSANAVTVDGNAAETIDGSTTLTISNQYDCYTMVSDGTEWFII